MTRRWAVFVLSLLVLWPAWRASPAAAQDEPRTCFAETGQCVEGRFHTYWNRNGGLPVFGFPITPERGEPHRDTNETYPTQWFERNRFERHAENAAPYDVLLGRLGDDRLRQLGRDWQAEPRESGPRPDCLWFDQTGHNVCNQAGALGFRAYWETHGLEFDGSAGVSAAESLALFGLPLTEPRPETNAAGDAVLTQWFERARFEWHPDKPDQFKVLLGLLGTELRQTSGEPPAAEAIEYTALGDSLATGIFAQKGYVLRYKDALQAATRRNVTLTNLGRNGWTSASLLQAIRSDEVFRGAIARAQVITFNVGGNDLREARLRYKSGGCGGADNQDCLRAGLTQFKSNWSEIVRELRALRDPSVAVMRTMDIYNPYVRQDRGADTWAQDGGRNDLQVFKPYVDEANSFIVATAAANSIPTARIYTAFNGPGGDEDPIARGYIAVDGLHPSDAGHVVLAQALDALGYAPLK